MVLGSDLITLHTRTGEIKTYTRAELEALASAGIMPSQIGAQDPEHLTHSETEMDEELYLAQILN